VRGGACGEREALADPPGQGAECQKPPTEQAPTEGADVRPLPSLALAVLANPRSTPRTAEQVRELLLRDHLACSVLDQEGLQTP